jgi:glycerol-3-phosphate acyltransferase PlsY
VGTLNAGSLNAFNTLGKVGGAVVFLVDFGKGVLAVLVPQWLNLPEAEVYASAIAVVVGHNWPVWLKFVGGKGVATSAGVALGLIPLLAVAALVPAIILLVTLKKFAIVGMGAGFVLLVALTYFMGEPLGVFVVIFAVSALVAIAQFTRPTWVRPEDMPSSASEGA